MLDFGFPELLLIMAVGVLVLGPKEIPKVMLALGRLVRRLGYIRYAFSQQFEEFMKEHDLEDVHKQVNFEAAPAELNFDEQAEDEDYMEPIDKKANND